MVTFPKLYRRLRYLSFVFLVTFLIASVGKALPIASATTPAQQTLSTTEMPADLVSQGIKLYQSGEFKAAIALWSKALSQPLTPQEAVTVHSNLAQAYRQIGQISIAIAHWEQAIAIAKKQKNQLEMGKLLTEQAQDYNDIGQHQRAIDILVNLVDIDRKNQDRSTLAAALGVTGNAYWRKGNYEAAISALQSSLEIARTLNTSFYITNALNNLGNVYASRSNRRGNQANLAASEGETKDANLLTKLAQDDVTAAMAAFSESTSYPNFQSLIGILKLALQQPVSTQNQPVVSNEKLVKIRADALQIISNLPNSQEKVNALTTIARLDLKYNSALKISISGANQPTTEKVLETAIATAKSIGGARAESFAAGTLAQMYEAQGEYKKALQFARSAQLAAQQIDAADSLYQWQWLTGRLLNITGDKPQAIESYKQAIATLQSIRSDIITANQDIQFDFRDSVEPVYRELISILLERGEFPSQDSSIANSQNLKEALKILDLLKLAELRDFFGDDCVEIVKEKAARNGLISEPQAAVIYSVIMRDRTEIILQLPDRSLSSYAVAISSQELEKQINLLRNSLEKRATEEYLPQSQKVYDLLLRPLEKQLIAAKPSTLVFINDGVLRKVPMDALHDGKQFLIEKYPVATTPSLNITPNSPINSKNPNSKLTKAAIALGLTVARPPFPALTNVATEVNDVKNILGGAKLLDADFTAPKLQEQLQKGTYPIIHIATHGKFGTDSQSTFLLAYDSQITIEQIDNLLRSYAKSPVELLTLSACQTAAGNNRSALGMGGVAVRAGVSSVLASLWSINDQATVPLIEEFYSQLKQLNITKAEALQKAKVKLIALPDYNHPAVWSPFILIGNWQ